MKCDRVLNFLGSLRFTNGLYFAFVSFHTLQVQLLIICSGLQVLSDSQKRAVYDQYGEEGLKGQVPPPGPGANFSNGDGPNVFRFNPRNAEDIFAEFFGGASPFSMGGLGGMGSRTSRSAFGDSMFGGFGGPDSIFRSFGESAPSSGSRKAAPIESKLPCSLEELYNGSTRKMKISRNIADASGYV